MRYIIVTIVMLCFSLVRLGYGHAIDSELKIEPFTGLNFTLEGMANCGCKKGDPFTKCTIYSDYEGFVGRE